MRTVDLIHRKREGEELNGDEIAFLVDGYSRGEIPDYQMSAFLMAVFFKGMSDPEVSTLTDLLVRSGESVDLSSIPGVKVDKHSTGGVGDKTSLISAPLAASAGVIVPMISGRALGHTGGTLDKLEAIPGLRTNLSLDEFRQTLAEHGLAFIGQTNEVAPDLLCCKMTLEHIGQTHRFLACVRSVANRKDSVIFFQVPDVGRILREGAFWDIYTSIVRILVPYRLSACLRGRASRYRGPGPGMTASI